MRVAFVGLGNMGLEMARNLIQAGHRLIVYNRTRSRTESLRTLGAEVADSAGEAAGNAEAVITMLADDSALEAVSLQPKGILQALRPGCTHIGMSTIGVSLAGRLAKSHSDHQQVYVAAPVFGRPEAAKAAKLFVVVSGPAGVIERHRSLFEAVGQQTFVVGEDPIAATVVKLAGNFLISTVIESLAESIALTRKFGVPPQQFLDLLTNSLFTAPVYKTYGAMIAAEKFEPVGFRMPLGLKDNRLVMAAAEQAAVPMPMASLVRDRFLSAIAQGLQEADWSAIARVAMQSAGL